jgi:hypothetical protein
LATWNRTIAPTNGHGTGSLSRNPRAGVAARPHFPAEPSSRISREVFGDVGVQLGPRSDQPQPGAEQVQQPAPLGGGGVGEQEVAAPEQPGDGLGVVAVGLRLRPVDRPHPPGVADGEGEALGGAGVGQPVPAVHALAPDQLVGAEGGDGPQERIELGREVLGQSDGAGLVEDADRERPCVQAHAQSFDVGGLPDGGRGWIQTAAVWPSTSRMIRRAGAAVGFPGRGPAGQRPFGDFGLG